MRLTLEQSQQVLFHCLALGNTDTISLDNFKSNTTTPSNEVGTNRHVTESSRTFQHQKQPSLAQTNSSRQGREAGISATDRSMINEPHSAQSQPQNSTDYKPRKSAELAASRNSKPRLMIHTAIDDDFQIMRSSIDNEEERLVGSGANTVIEDDDLALISGDANDKDKALESF